MPNPATRYGIPAVAAVIALACQASPSAPDPLDAPPVVTAAAPRDPHSITGRLTGQLVASAVPQTGLHRLDVTATGEITHVGRVTATWALPQVLFDFTNRQAISQVATWSGAIVTANGDRIDGRYTLRSQAVDVSPVGDFEILADVTILDGTGRFSGVHGAGVSYVRGNAVTGALTVEVTGSFLPSK